MKPVIAVTCDHDRARQRHELSYAVVEAVAAAGGEPILLPFHDAGTLPPFVDGCVFSGGNDPDPAAWGEPWHPACNPVDPARERHERRLVLEAERRDLPAVGICFGMQAMNLVRGGTLIQHLGDDPRHDDHTRGGDGWERRHPVEIVGGSTFARTCGGAELSVNTSHHQAVGVVGSGLRAVAHSPDGVVEAIEDPSRRLWVGVQWHPERQAGEPRHAALFATLVEAARR